LSSFFVPEDEDTLLGWVEKVLADKAPTLACTHARMQCCGSHPLHGRAARAWVAKLYFFHSIFPNRLTIFFCAGQ
jgi:hypothetical protein